MAIHASNASSCRNTILNLHVQMVRYYNIVFFRTGYVLYFRNYSLLCLIVSQCLGDYLVKIRQEIVYYITIKTRKNIAVFLSIHNVCGSNTRL